MRGEGADVREMATVALRGASRRGRGKAPGEGRQRGRRASQVAVKVSLPATTAEALLVRGR